MPSPVTVKAGVVSLVGAPRPAARRDRTADAEHPAGSERLGGIEQRRVVEHVDLAVRTDGDAADHREAAARVVTVAGGGVDADQAILGGDAVGGAGPEHARAWS